jgi:hypothetical protein
MKAMRDNDYRPRNSLISQSQQPTTLLAFSLAANACPLPIATNPFIWWSMHQLMRNRSRAQITYQTIDNIIVL